MAIKKSIVFGFIVASVLTSGLVSAHGGATGVVKSRMDSMKVMGKRMRSVKAMLTGKVSLDANKIAVWADEISLKSGESAKLFPEGSAKSPSEALPVIWEQWDDFTQRFDSLNSAAADLKAAAQTNDPAAIQKSFGKVGEQCGSCHKKFRQEDE